MAADFVTEMSTLTGEKEDCKVMGVAVAQVVNNVDSTMQGRVQIMLSWAPNCMPWARVAAPSAGLASGSYFMPQIGSEVVVAFNDGDIRDPYIIGAVWNAIDRPLLTSPTDAVTKSFIRSTLGHEIEFDDALQSLTVTSTTQQKIKLDPTNIELTAGVTAASIKLTTDGDVTITAAKSLTITAPTVKINGANVTVAGTAKTMVTGGTSCEIAGAIVKLN